MERLADEKKDEIASLTQELEDAKNQLQLEIEGNFKKLADKDRQIKELKGQRDAIFEEMQGSTGKKETRHAEMMPNIYSSAIGSGFS